MRIKSVVLSFLGGFLIWLGLNSSGEKEVIFTGIIIAAVVALFFTRVPVLGDVKLTPRALVALVVWLLVFLVELVKSNIDVMFRVVTPRVKINPAIVEVKTRLKSPLGRLALANSITLTPGTLTADIKDDRLFIHWIDATTTDVEGATKKIVDKFEKHLEVLFG